MRLKMAAFTRSLPGWLQIIVGPSGNLFTTEPDGRVTKLSPR